MNKYPAYIMALAAMIARLPEEDQELLELLQEFLEVSRQLLQEEPDPMK